MSVTSNLCSGNIQVQDISDLSNIQLVLVPEPFCQVSQKFCAYQRMAVIIQHKMHGVAMGSHYVQLPSHCASPALKMHTYV